MGTLKGKNKVNDGEESEDKEEKREKKRTSYEVMTKKMMMKRIAMKNRKTVSRKRW